MSDKSLFERIAEGSVFAQPMPLPAFRRGHAYDHFLAEPLMVPKAVYDAAKRDPRYAEACRRGDIQPVLCLKP